MADQVVLMARGLPAGVADKIGSTLSTGLTAAGSTKATALVLSATNNVFSTTASLTGALLPFAQMSPDVAIYNGGAQPLLVYAQAGDTINALSTGATFSVTNGKSARFCPSGQKWIATLSA